MAELVAAFPELEGKFASSASAGSGPRSSYASFRAVFEHAVKKMGFSILCIITGLDEGENLGFIYHLADRRHHAQHPHPGAQGRPRHRTITDLFPAGAHLRARARRPLRRQVEASRRGTAIRCPTAGRRGSIPSARTSTAVLDAVLGRARAGVPAASGGEGA